MSRDARLLIAGQALRAFGYGFTAVVLGAVLAARGVGVVRAGVLLAALIAGSALASLVAGAVADRWGRRRSYGCFFAGVALAGVVVASDPSPWVLFVVGLTGTLSTDVVDNGAATTLEQVMLARDDAGTGRVYGWYNALGASVGALGALGAGVAGATTSRSHDALLFLVLVPVGLAGLGCALALSPGVEAPRAPREGERAPRVRLGESRPVIRRLAGLFALDAAGGGLVTTGFLSYYLARRYGASLEELGWLFFAVSALQAVSVLVAPRLARRIGLVPTMVATHLPSNALLLAMAFAPTFDVAVVLLLVRVTLSQMDVPTRQALVMVVTPPEERTAAAAATNAARYAARPFAPLAGAALQTWSLGAPLVVAGLVKGGYDVALWSWARRMPSLRVGFARRSSTSPAVEGEGTT